MLQSTVLEVAIGLVFCYASLAFVASDLKIPSYIDANHFAIAFIEAIQTIPGDYAQLGKNIDDISDPQIRSMLKGMYDRANNSLFFGGPFWFDILNKLVNLRGAGPKPSRPTRTAKS
jgi:hypothetical protein